MQVWQNGVHSILHRDISGLVGVKKHRNKLLQHRSVHSELHLWTHGLRSWVWMWKWTRILSLSLRLKVSLPRSNLPIFHFCQCPIPPSAPRSSSLRSPLPIPLPHLLIFFWQVPIEPLPHMAQLRSSHWCPTAHTSACCCILCNCHKAINTGRTLFLPALQPKNNPIWNKRKRSPSSQYTSIQVSNSTNYCTV